jgi:hypothetical protein
MSRGWAPTELREFAKLRRDVEAVVQRCGRETFDLLLIDVEGDWIRTVVPSEKEARAMSRDLGVRIHVGWDDPRLGRRMNRRDHWGRPGGRRRAL